MTQGTARRSRATRLVAWLAGTLAVGLGLALGGALPAAAHTQVSPATPEPGSTVTTGPVTIALNTTEPILASGLKSIVVRGPGEAEEYFGDGCTEVSNGGTTLSADVTLGEPGEYTVIWTLVAEDGHTQSSNDFEPYTFTWQPDAGEEQASGASEIPTCGADAPANGDDSNATDGPGAGDSENSTGSQDAAEAPDASDAESADASDIAWLVAAGAIVFIAVAAVVMIAVRRRMLSDDEDDESGDAASSRQEPPFS